MLYIKDLIELVEFLFINVRCALIQFWLFNLFFGRVKLWLYGRAHLLFYLKLRDGDHRWSSLRIKRLVTGFRIYWWFLGWFLRCLLWRRHFDMGDDRPWLVVLLLLVDDQLLSLPWLELLPLLVHTVIRGAQALNFSAIHKRLLTDYFAHFLWLLRNDWNWILALFLRFDWLCNFGHIFVLHALALPKAFLKHIDVGFLATVVEIVAILLHSPGLGIARRGNWEISINHTLIHHSLDSLQILQIRDIVAASVQIHFRIWSKALFERKWVML